MADMDDLAESECVELLKGASLRSSRFRGTGWSVVVTGTAQAVVDPAELDDLRQTPLLPWAPVIVLSTSGSHPS
jgi:hypothetical protein